MKKAILISTLSLFIFSGLAITECFSSPRKKKTKTEIRIKKKNKKKKKKGDNGCPNIDC